MNAHPSSLSPCETCDCTDAQIISCNGDPHKVEREAHFALQDRMFFQSANPRVRALQAAIEGELDGLGVSNLKAEAILRHLDAASQPVAWVRWCSDGTYEGPVMDARLEDVRKQSGAWTPLYGLRPTTTETEAK